jgi:hypothetical protein
MALTDEQRRRVQWLLEGHLMEDDLAEGEFIAKWEQAFAALESSEELFVFAYHSTGDTTAQEWRRVIDNPLCDLGTALLVFWRNSPGRLYQYASATDVPYDDGRYALVKDIEWRYLAGAFPDRALRFDPSSFRGHNLLVSDTADGGGIERIPVELRRPSPGRPVPLLW